MASESTVSLGTKLVQAVQKEAAMQRPLPMRAIAQESAGAGRVTASVDLADNDRFSHMADEVEVKVSRSNAKGPSPRQIAERLAERASYLTESLQFVEHTGNGAAILRSTPQTMRGSRAEYYEAQVQSDAVTLRRFKPNTDRPGRLAVPFCVTDDVLGRLVDDAAGVLTSGKK
jgi:hypothetical protein